MTILAALAVAGIIWWLVPGHIRKSALRRDRRAFKASVRSDIKALETTGDRQGDDA